MSQIPSLFNSKPTDQAFGEHNALNDLNLDTFLKLMISELQNQDPLNPMDNAQMLSQINEMRQIGATDKLTSTLNSVLLGQNLSSSTYLIGSDVVAISDDNEPVSGTVDRVTIDGGDPKLHLDVDTKAKPSTEAGNVEAGKYNYRVVWQDDVGNLVGIELSGEDAVTTTGKDGKDSSVLLSSLPVTDGPKQIYRSKGDGTGRYQLAATLPDGKKGSYLDKASDDELSTVTLSSPFQRAVPTRSSIVSLKNVSEIRPSSL